VAARGLLCGHKYMHTTRCFLASRGQDVTTTASRIYSVLIRVHKLAWKKKRGLRFLRKIVEEASEI